ncbi:MAG: hypothetical protein JXJ17_07020 [Anaerolineae bacterium]|nr:hypothetical protein [Anaerolineae bacterium]
MNNADSPVILVVSIADILIATLGCIVMPFVVAKFINNLPLREFVRHYPGARDSNSYKNDSVYGYMKLVAQYTSQDRRDRDRNRGWFDAHIWFLIGAVALLFVPGLFYAILTPNDPLAVPALLSGVIGGVFMLLAIVIDMYCTPTLARIMVDENADETRKESAWLVWRTYEYPREVSFKSLSLVLLGMWMAWLYFGVIVGAEPGQWIGRMLRFVSLIGGLSLIFLGMTQALKMDQFGQRGKYGKPLLAGVILIWGVCSATWLTMSLIQ